MKYFVLSFLLLTFCGIYSQPKLPDDYILPLPEGLDSSTVDLDDLKKALDRLHTFSEYIYNPIKITIIDSISYSPKNLTDAGSSDRWGAGTWGRGLFSKFVDRYLVDEVKNTAYNSFYKEHSNPKLKNHYWGTHPIVSYCARTIRSYINLLYCSNEVIVKSFCLDRIIAGAKYLILQQRLNGSFVQWHWRKSKNKPNIDDEIGLNDTNSYPTANVIVALAGVYDLLSENRSNNPNLISELHTTIENAGDFLVNNNNSSSHNNYISFSIWGLVSAYRITKNEKYLETALKKYSDEVGNFQDSSGAWYKNLKETLDYHDAHSPYMGIILRALIDLYNVLPYSCNYETKARLRKSIIKGINHFLLPNIVHANYSNQNVRLAKDGGIFPYSKQKEYTKNKGRALQLSQSLIYALKCDGLCTDTEDLVRLRGFLNAVMKYQVNETINHKKVLHINSDIYFESLALYLRLQNNSKLE